jgi:hypothetical protein
MRLAALTEAQGDGEAALQWFLMVCCRCCSYLIRESCLRLQAARHSGTDASLWHRCSRLALELGKLLEARQALLAALNASPRHVASAVMLQLVLYRLRDLPVLAEFSDKYAFFTAHISRLSHAQTVILCVCYRCIRLGINVAQSFLYKAHAVKCMLYTSEHRATVESAALSYTSRALSIDADVKLPLLDGASVLLLSQQCSFTSVNFDVRRRAALR